VAVGHHGGVLSNDFGGNGAAGRTPRRGEEVHVVVCARIGLVGGDEGGVLDGMSHGCWRESLGLGGSRLSRKRGRGKQSCRKERENFHDGQFYQKGKKSQTENARKRENLRMTKYEVRSSESGAGGAVLQSHA